MKENGKYVHNNILLPNFQSLFKVQKVFSSSVAGLCLFGKGEVKNLSKVD